jgi:hypothetical protein
MISSWLVSLSCSSMGDDFGRKLYAHFALIINILPSVLAKQNLIKSMIQIALVTTDKYKQTLTFNYVCIHLYLHSLCLILVISIIFMLVHSLPQLHIIFFTLIHCMHIVLGVLLFLIFAYKLICYSLNTYSVIIQSKLCNSLRT